RGMTKRQRPKDGHPLPPAPPDPLDDLAVLREIPPDLRGVEVRECRLADADLTGRDAHGLQLIESRVQGVDLARAVLRRATLRDVVISGGDWANIDAAETIIRRVELRGLRLTGAVLAAAKLQDAYFIQCRLDLCSLRFATLDRVRFEDCRMEEADFYEAALNSVAFVDCDLSRATLAKATFERCEMRGCELGGINGADRLRGVTMPWLDILRSAAVLADGVGVQILDED
ncbi:MAG: pentapeptide repeat-containing protein, partial [Actinomycetota bacterium]|nr:pentapeptide repeat-containing protein [Actinomycetota bacterium]